MNNQEYKKLLIERVIRFCKDSIRLVDSLPQKRSCFIMSDQFLRSATSIGANIIEAQAGSSHKDFIKFINYALKSANETVFWLGLLIEVRGTQEELIKSLMQEAEELSKILGSTIIKLKNK